jgi:hypothetical protein
MALSAEELLVGGTGAIAVAPVGTTLPTAVDEALDAAFADLGYTTEDGVTFKDSKEIRLSKAWQAFNALRRTVVSRDTEASMALKQWNSDTLQTGFGGGSVEDLGGGDFIYHPPVESERNEQAIVIDIVDGDEKWRIVIPAAEVTSNTETKFARSEDSALAVTFGVNAGNTGDDPWYLCTNSTAMVAAS